MPPLSLSQTVSLLA